MAPSLERLELAFYYVEDAAFVWGAVVKLKALRHFRIDSHFRCSNAEKAALTLQIIRLLPQLESLVIHNQDDQDSPILELAVLSLVPTLPVPNLNLSHLDLWDSRATRWTLCNLVIPALKSLRLYRDYPTNLVSDVNLGEVIQLLVQRSSCTLKSLRLEAVSPIRENLLETFRELTTLEAIELRCGCATGGLAAGRGDPIQSLQFLHELSTTAAPFSLKSCLTDFLPSLKEFIYHDDLLDAKYIPDLIVHFKSFVEHRSRGSDQVATVEAEFPAPRRDRPPVIWRKRRPGRITSVGLSDSVDGTFDLIKEYNPLENAVLYAGGHTDPPVYSRAVDPPFTGPPEAAAASADRLNGLRAPELKSLMKDCAVTALCSKPKKQDLIDGILTALHPPSNSQVDSIIAKRRLATG